jgi:hypothetical protein
MALYNNLEKGTREKKYPDGRLGDLVQQWKQVREYMDTAICNSSGSALARHSPTTLRSGQGRKKYRTHGRMEIYRNTAAIGVQRKKNLKVEHLVNLSL